MKYKIGDRVRLNPKSRCAGPEDVVGTVVSCAFIVEWGEPKGGEPKRNIYAESALIPVPNRPAVQRTEITKKGKVRRGA